MFARLLAAFILIPLVELILLLQVARVMGPGPTLILIIVTGILGASLARQQGFRAWTRIQQELQAGRVPASELIDGLLILIGGVVLLTPGLLTDACGFALLIPRIRQFVKKRLTIRFEKTSHQYRPPPGDDYIDV